MKVINASLKPTGVIKNISKDNDVDFTTEKFDYIVTNPPYTPIDVILAMAPEIQ